MTRFFSVDSTNMYLLLILIFDFYFCFSIVSKLQTSRHLWSLSDNAHRSIPHRAHCWQLQHTMQSRFSSMLNSQPGRYKVHKRWYWYNAFDDPKIDSTSDANKQQHDSNNSENKNNEQCSSKLHITQWYQCLTSIIVGFFTWISGRMTITFAKWLLVCCIFILKKLVRCIWHCGRIIAEHHICTVSDISRSILIHAATKRPDKITPSLWPFAIMLAVDVWNHTPRGENGAPIDLFSKFRRSDISYFHPFGCPVFILNKKLQNSLKIPRWDPCCHRGIDLGRSQNHADNAAIVLDLNTGSITAQYHLIFDDTFDTVISTDEELSIIVPRLYSNSNL